MPVGLGYVGLAKEAQFGVAVAPTIFLPVKSADASTDPQNYYPEEIRGSRSRSRAVATGRKHELSLEIDAEPQNIGHLLLAALGGVTTTSIDLTAYSHVFMPGNTLPSYTFELYDTVMTRRLSGAKLDTLSLAVEAGGDGVLTVESTFFVQSIVDQGAASTPNYSDKGKFVFTSATVEKGGASNDNVRSFELEIANNLKDDHYVIRKSRDVSEINEGMREVTGSLEMYFKTKAEYTAFMDGDGDSLKITFEGATISGANVEKLEIELPAIVYDAFEIPMDGPDEEIMASLEFTALYDATSAFDVKITLVSAATAY